MGGGGCAGSEGDLISNMCLVKTGKRPLGLCECSVMDPCWDEFSSVQQQSLSIGFPSAAMPTLSPIAALAITAERLHLRRDASTKTMTASFQFRKDTYKQHPF